MRKISNFGTEVYAVRGHFDRRHPCKAILEPDNVKDGRYLRGFLVKHLLLHRGRDRRSVWAKFPRNCLDNDEEIYQTQVEPFKGYLSFECSNDFQNNCFIC